MHFPVGQRVPARPLPGEEYGESKNTTESDWFARGFCNDSDADRNLEPSRGRRLMQLCECADSFRRRVVELRFVAVICPAHQPAKVLKCLGIANGIASLLASGIGAFGLGGFSPS
jgi:hypothetical protein